MVEEKTTAKIEDMFKPIGASTVFYVKITEDNAVDKLETIIEKLQKLKDQSEGEQRVGRSGKRKSGKDKYSGGASGGDVGQNESLLRLEDDLKVVQKEKVKQQILQSDGSPVLAYPSPPPSPTTITPVVEQAYPSPPPSPTPPTKGEITTTV
jgi:hypothetical protein